MIKNALFAIGIPTLNRADLLNPTLEKYVLSLFPNTEIFICDNGDQQLMIDENIAVLKQFENLYVSGSWNELCRLIFLHYDYCLMLNDDICLSAKESQVNQLIEENPTVGFFNSYWQWSSYLLSAKTFKEIGPFDEELRIWFNDNDYEYRMKKAGVNMLATSVLNPVNFVKDGTVSKNPVLHRQFELDRQAYIRKHGAGPGSELF